MKSEIAYGAAFLAAIAAFAVLGTGVLGVPGLTPAAIAAVPEEDAQLAASVPLFDYIEIEDSCGAHYDGECALARTRPATSSPVAARLRGGMVLEVATTTIEADGHTWYRVVFDEKLRYPARVTDDWYVAADTVSHFMHAGGEELGTDAASTSSPQAATKHIVIDRTTETLYAYDGDTLFLQTPVSTGLDRTPTSLGEFTIYKKTPSRYMQGPIPSVSKQYYDLPGVPWDLYFTKDGGAIHGAYWHNKFGQEWSHGCVNVPLDYARALYEWAPLGTPVTVQD